jgi:hypothetical protein
MPTVMTRKIAKDTSPAQNNVKSDIKLPDLRLSNPNASGSDDATRRSNAGTRPSDVSAASPQSITIMSKAVNKTPVPTNSISPTTKQWQPQPRDKARPLTTLSSSAKSLPEKPPPTAPPTTKSTSTGTSPPTNISGRSTSASSISRTGTPTLDGIGKEKSKAGRMNSSSGKRLRDWLSTHLFRVKKQSTM